MDSFSRTPKHSGDKMDNISIGAAQLDRFHDQRGVVRQFSRHESVADGAEWAETKPLQRTPSTATPFPVDALGPVLGGAAKTMAEVIQAPLAICGNSVLAAATLAAQGHANVIIDGRIHPLSEFFMTIGMTGERKSAVDNVALWPHRKRQEQLRVEHKAALAEYERNADAFKKARDESMASGKNKSYAAKKEALATLGDAPEEPLAPFLICEEPTYEGLVKMLAHGQPSIGLFTDEGGRFIGGHGMNSDNLLKTASGMSGFWDGKPVSRVRGGDGSSLLVGRRVACHLMAQPEVAQLMLSNSVLIAQGLLSRCLVTWPDSTAGKRLYREIDLSVEPAIKRYSAVILDLLETPFPMREGTRNELNPRELCLSADAKRVWIEFHNAIEKELVDGGKLALVRGLANKAPEHAARIAGTLAIVADKGCGSIAVEYIKAGILLVTHYLNEAQRLYEAEGADAEIRTAEKLLAWLTPQAGKLVTLVDVYQKGPNTVRTAKTARSLMQVLQDHGYVRPTADEKRREAWRVRHDLHV